LACFAENVKPAEGYKQVLQGIAMIFNPIEMIKKLAAQGMQSQLDQTQEECAELIQAISKFRRKKTVERKHDLLEEIADVSIMVMQLYEIFGKDEIEKRIKEKLARSKGRLENGNL
jgi:NTP pyrophosphatase (non-canonical NTP hydrolase)